MSTKPTTVFNSATASATSKKTYSPPAMKLAAMLNEAIRKDLTFRQTSICIEFILERPEIHAGTNSHKFYAVDVLLMDNVTGISFALEAMGEGSKSDDILRHKFMCDHGIIPVYIQNHDIDHAPHLVMREIRMKLKLLRMVCQ